MRKPVENSLRVEKQIVERRRPVLNANTGKHFWSSEEGHKADALALGAEEGRDKLR